MDIVYIYVNDNIYPFTRKMIEKSTFLADMSEEYQNDLHLDEIEDKEGFNLLYEILANITKNIKDFLRVSLLAEYLAIDDIINHIEREIVNNRISYEDLINNYEYYKDIPIIKELSIFSIIFSNKYIELEWPKQEFDKIIKKRFPGYLVFSLSKNQHLDISQKIEKGTIEYNLIGINKAETLLIIKRNRESKIITGYRDSISIDLNDLITYMAFDPDLLLSSDPLNDKKLSDDNLLIIKRIIENKSGKLSKGNIVIIQPYSRLFRIFALYYNGKKLVYPVKYTISGNGFSTELIFPGPDFIFPKDKIESIYTNQEFIRYIDDYLIKLFNTTDATTDIITDEVNKYKIKNIAIDGVNYEFATNEELELGKIYYVAHFPIYAPEKIKHNKLEKAYIITSKLESLYF